MKTLIISPFSKKLRNDKENPKNYPYWPELIKLLKDEYHIIQIGVDGETRLTKDCRFNLPLPELKKLVATADLWISVDTFLPHLANLLNKPGVVIWGVSDPKLFGYPTNLNILKDRKYLRKNQFDIWESQEFSKEPFLSAQEVYKIIKNDLSNKHYRIKE